MKGQLSLEVLFVLGLIFVFLIPILFYFFYQYGVVSQHVTQEHSLQWIDSMRQAVENVYYGGPGTRIAMDQILPASIKRIQAKYEGNKTFLIYEFDDGTQIVSYFPMRVELVGDSWNALSSFKISVENNDGIVKISPVS